MLFLFFFSSFGALEKFMYVSFYFIVQSNDEQKSICKYAYYFVLIRLYFLFFNPKIFFVYGWCFCISLTENCWHFQSLSLPDVQRWITWPVVSLWLNECKIESAKNKITQRITLFMRRDPSSGATENTLRWDRPVFIFMKMPFILHSERFIWTEIETVISLDFGNNVPP